MTETEHRYAQVEKEALAVIWACERLSDYLIGKTFHFETDHKPLASFLGDKNLNELPPRFHRLPMKLLWFKYTNMRYGIGLLLWSTRLPVSQASKSPKVGR